MTTMPFSVRCTCILKLTLFRTSTKTHQQSSECMHFIKNNILSLSTYLTKGKKRTYTAKFEFTLISAIRTLFLYC